MCTHISVPLSFKVYAHPCVCARRALRSTTQMQHVCAADRTSVCARFHVYMCLKHTIFTSMPCYILSLSSCVYNGRSSVWEHTHQAPCAQWRATAKGKILTMNCASASPSLTGINLRLNNSHLKAPPMHKCFQLFEKCTHNGIQSQALHIVLKDT